MAKKKYRKLKKSKNKVLNYLLTALVLIGYFVWHNLDKVDLNKSSESNLGQMIKMPEKTNKTDKKVVNSNNNSIEVKNNFENFGTLEDYQLPEFDGSTPYVTIYDNIPRFTDEEKASLESFEYYSDLDYLGRVGVSFANLSRDTMPEYGEKRGSISRVRPSGWGTYRFSFVDGGYLYNRAHMIGWQLSAENDNEKNLATGTRYFNVDGMLPFESLVADYIKNTGNHVLYRVTPVFVDDELVMRGLQMEAYSVEDNGTGVSYNVYVFNAQPGVYIDYLTGTAVSE